jgi:type I restriction enzyme S subunit
MLTHRTATILGDIPTDWGRELLGDLLERQQGGDWGDDDGEAAVSVLRSTNFTDCGTLDFRDVAIRYFKGSKAETFWLKEKDLLLERSGGGPSQPVGRIGFVHRDLPGHWFSNFVQLLRADADKIDPEFLGWVLLELNRSGIVERLQHQTTQMRNLDFRDYLRAYLPKPSHEEQEAIARILRISNASLAAAEAKLTAARRLKTALMQQLFTRGIPGRHSRFKPARVFRHEFEVPELWEVMPLRNSVIAVEYGTNAPSNDAKHGLPVVAIPEVIASRFRLGECSYAEVPDEEANSLRLQTDDVLLIRTNGNSEYIGKSTVIGDEAAEKHIIFASYLIRIRTDKSVSGRYLNYFLASPLGRRLCLAMANTSAGNHNLGSRAIKQFIFPRPSPDEQTEIVGLVDAAEDSIEAVLDELATLERLKRSLLQNLLTGKVRVKSLDVSP